VHILDTTSRGKPLASTSINGDNSGRERSVGHERNVSASTPVKDDRSAGRIDMSSNNISPIRDCRVSPTGRPQIHDPKLQRTLTPQSPPGDKHRTAPITAQQPYVRPASGRSAMDLYAAIHESKKRLLGQQPATVAVTAPVQAKQHRTQPQMNAAAVVRRSPERQSDRYRPRGDDRSAARYDFKRLLLQTNMAGGRRAQQSAVVRLQQPPPPPRAVPAPLLSTGAGSHFRRTPSGSSFRKSNVLASTIQEDCREDEECHGASVVPRSATLVSRTLKGLQAAATPTCSALETSL